MPTNIVKTKHDEKLWAKAKIAASKYKSVKKGSDQYWAITNGIFQRMKGNVSGKTATANKRLTKADYIKMAQSAASEYFSDKVDLNEAVAKIAFIHGLGPDQISNVCSTANHLIYASLLKENEASDDKYIDFEIARPEKIAKEIDSLTQVADKVYFNPDALFSPPVVKRASTQESSGEFINKTIRREQMLQQNIKNISIAHTKVAGELLSEVDKAERGIDKLYEYIKTAILSGKDIKVVELAVSKAFDDSNNFSLVWGDIISRLIADNVIERPPSDDDYKNTTEAIQNFSPDLSSPIIVTAADIDRRLNKADELEKTIYGLEKLAKVTQSKLSKEIVAEKMAGIGIGKWVSKNVLKRGAKAAVKKEKKGMVSKLFDVGFVATGIGAGLKKNVRVKRSVR